jgi:hypothetical protein
MEAAAKLGLVGKEKPEIQKPPTWDGKTLILAGVHVDMVGLRDMLLALRDNVYCPECHCPNWATDRDERIHHYDACSLGKFTETILSIVPKKDITVRWKQE